MLCEFASSIDSRRKRTTLLGVGLQFNLLVPVVLFSPPLRYRRGCYAAPLIVSATTVSSDIDCINQCPPSDSGLAADLRLDQNFIFWGVSVNMDWDFQGQPSE
ncbi:hypothetical protein BaRGS_00023568 [Batillaria attramentaria]|uniref:Uncharacterized protein n=1 Tax=Batillaria attramentaria TaxID=370345 RepID=A0ABD0KDF0_9CAEN